MDRLQVLHNISQHFITKPSDSIFDHASREKKAEDASATTIGVEIEVKFSSFYPTVYHGFGLNTRKYEDFVPAEKAVFDKVISEHEAYLLPHLKQTVEMGVPKGKDRYWEFAHRPVFHPYTLAEEIGMLRRNGLIPTNQKHSLHVTVALPEVHSRDVGMLLMVLEMLGYSSSKRIRDAIDTEKAIGWGRKGNAGIRHRTTDLENADHAFELRTLELPTSHEDVKKMLYTIWFLCEAIRRPDMRPSWLRVLKQAEELALRHTMDTTENWGPSFTNVDKWMHLADTLDVIDNTQLWTVVDMVIHYQDKFTPPNQYLQDMYLL